MTHEQIIMMLESARKNMMDDSMRDYAGEQIDVAIAELKIRELPPTPLLQVRRNADGNPCK